MTLLAGSSGYSYKEWKGRFYPERLAASKMLGYYAERLPTVEINNTFYRLPKRETLAAWAEQVPDSFRFAIKASRKITHFKKLNDCADELNFLLDNLEELGETLGAVLFQLPPYLKCDPERLTAFLALLPEGLPAAFEFRSSSWSDEAIYDALRQRNFTWVVADTDKAPLSDIPVVTADWGYLRLRRTDYSDDELRAWRQRCTDAEWRRSLVFFKHEDEAAAPELARRLIAESMT